MKNKTVIQSVGQPACKENTKLRLYDSYESYVIQNWPQRHVYHVGIEEEMEHWIDDIIDYQEQEGGMSKAKRSIIRYGTA